MIVHNGNIVVNNGRWIIPPIPPEPDPYNPLNLPPYTIRLKYSKGTTPTFTWGTGVLVDSVNNIWDLTYNNSDWSYLLRNHSYLIEVLGGNTSNVSVMNRTFNDCIRLTSVQIFNTTNVVDLAGSFNGDFSLTSIPLFNTSNVNNFNGMFAYCYDLTSVPLFDTSNATNLNGMLTNCRSLTSIPLFNTSKATTVGDMCYACNNVETGALALYNQMSTQTTPPTDHYHTFMSCGSNTQTGSAELAQIPSDWK